MKRHALALAALVFVLMLPAASVSAQTTYVTQTITGPATYTVVSGDTVWDLSPSGVANIKAANSFLASRSFTMANGGDGLLIYPGETLTIPAGVTITFRRPRVVAATPNPTPTPNPAPIVIAAATPDVTWEQVRNFGLWMFLLTLLALALLGYLLYRALARRLQENEDNASRRNASVHRAIRQMEERQVQRDDRREGLVFTLLVTVMDYFHSLQGTLIELRNEFGGNMRRLRREIQQANVVVQQVIGQPVIDRRAQPVNVVNADGPTDFVEVHRNNGERISLNVVHGSNLTPQMDGVDANGRVTILTADAARRHRDRAELLREEREAVGV